MRVLLIEDHGLLADSLTFALQAEGLEATKVSPTDRETLLDVARDTKPDLVLLDLDLGWADADGTVMIEPLRDTGALVVMLTGVSDRARLGACLEAGAVGIIAKSLPFDEVLEAVKETVELGSLTTKAQRDAMLHELRQQRLEDQRRLEPFEKLTTREREVLAALVDGKSAETIATKSFVSVATVRSQIRAILLKLDVSSQLEAVAIARRNGWPN
jgi:DNA-binding NarL/FixJ family response regulator